MNRQHVYKQIMAILEASSYTWSQTSSGGIYLRFSSAGVAIEIVDRGAQMLIEISSHVLTGVEGRTKRVLKELNALNMSSHFGRWVFYPETKTIAVEYDLLGDHLQENELMTSLLELARLADYHDDLLQQKVGGRRAFES